MQPVQRVLMTGSGRAQQLNPSIRTHARPRRLQVNDARSFRRGHPSRPSLRIGQRFENADRKVRGAPPVDQIQQTVQVYTRLSRKPS
jgi:hypothetical protein